MDSGTHPVKQNMCFRRQRGQMLLELLWLSLLACVFLGVISYLYDKGKTEIQNSRIIKFSKPKQRR